MVACVVFFKHVLFVDIYGLLEPDHSCACLSLIVLPQFQHVAFKILLLSVSTCPTFYLTRSPSCVSATDGLKCRQVCFPYKAMSCCSKFLHLGFLVRQKKSVYAFTSLNLMIFGDLNVCIMWCNTSNSKNCDLGLGCDMIRNWGCSCNYVTPAHMWVGSAVGGVLIYSSSSSMSQPAALPSYNPLSLLTVAAIFSLLPLSFIHHNHNGEWTSFL